MAKKKKQEENQPKVENFKSLAGGIVKTLQDDLSSDMSYVYPFECAVVDIPFGGGIYAGKVYELYGWESVGKSTFSLEITKAFERFWNNEGKSLGKKHGILWIESESALDKVRAKWIGCNPDNWLIMEGETIEDVQDVLVASLDKALANNIVMLIVWDTIAAAETRAEKESGTNSGGMAGKPRAVRAFFRKIVGRLGGTNSTLVLVNQLNKTLDMHKPDDTPMPAIKFYASVRTKMTKREELRKITAAGDEITYGIITELKHEKNKLIQRGQKSLIVIDNENGFDRLDTTFRYLKKARLVTVKGAGWTEIQVPARPFNKDNKEPIAMEDVKFQTLDKLKGFIEVQYPHLHDWMEYLIYRSYTEVSPLVKVKIIKKVWDYEMYFFGEKRTQLEEKEIEVAKMIFKELEKEEKSNKQ